jgi:hypothetical protein
MDELVACLKKFHGIPLKRGLKSSNAYDDDIAKVVNTTMSKAFELSILVEDLKNQVAGIQPKGNARFSSQRIISNFLSIES